MSSNVKNIWYVKSITLVVLLLCPTIQGDIFDALAGRNIENIKKEAEQFNNIKHTKDGLTPLHFALRFDTFDEDTKILLGNINKEIKEKMLLAYTSSDTEEGKRGLTPLHFTLLYPNPGKRAKILLSNVDKNIKEKMFFAYTNENAKENDRGLIPLHFALSFNNPSEQIKSLLDNVDKNIKEKMLLAYTSSDASKNFRGLTPLHFALFFREQTKKNIITFLKNINDNELKKKIFLKKGEAGIAENLNALEFAQKRKTEGKLDKKIVDYLQNEYDKLFPPQLTIIQNLLALLKTKLVKLLHAVKALQN